jgi:cytidylate kinase
MPVDKLPIVVALDGPAGVGKSTVAMAIAAALDLAYVETGALYRAVGLLARQRGISLNDPEALGTLAAGMDVRFRLEGAVNHVVVDRVDVTDALRHPDMGPVASRVSSYPQVRQALLPLQRSFAQRLPGAVAEGRDIGTVVFPAAQFKFFLTATVPARVERRRLQLLAKGRSVPAQELEREITERDLADSSRKVAPLKAADDAVVVDTSGLSARQVVERILEHIRERV